MANTTNSPNMSLPIPTVGVESGPQYANDVNNCFTLVDQHNHSPGYGVQITPSGLNISTDLSIKNNNLILTRTVNFTAQNAAITASAPDLGCLYVAGSDLYFNDEAGNQIRLTQSGAIVGSAGSISGLPSGTASAAYSAGVFTFQSATNTPADVDGRSFVLRNNLANSKGLTLAPPNSMGANYSLVLPLIPASSSFMTIDTSGNLSGSINTNAGITGSNIASGTIAGSNIASGTIAGSNIAAATITQGLLASRLPYSSAAGLGQILSTDSCGLFTTTSAANQQVTNLIGTIVTSGNRPVMLALMADGSSNYARMSGAATGVVIKFIKGSSTVVAIYQVPQTTEGASLFAIDFPTAGTQTYKVLVESDGSTTIAINYYSLYVWEQ